MAPFHSFFPCSVTGPLATATAALSVAPPPSSPTPPDPWAALQAKQRLAYSAHNPLADRAGEDEAGEAEEEPQQLPVWVPLPSSGSGQAAWRAVSSLGLLPALAAQQPPQNEWQAPATVATAQPPRSPSLPAQTVSPLGADSPLATSASTELLLPRQSRGRSDAAPATMQQPNATSSSGGGMGRRTDSGRWEAPAASAAAWQAQQAQQAQHSRARQLSTAISIAQLQREGPQQGGAWTVIPSPPSPVAPPPPGAPADPAPEVEQSEGISQPSPAAQERLQQWLQRHPMHSPDRLVAVGQGSSAVAEQQGTWGQTGGRPLSRPKSNAAEAAGAAAAGPPEASLCQPPSPGEGQRAQEAGSPREEPSEHLTHTQAGGPAARVECCRALRPTVCALLCVRTRAGRLQLSICCCL